MIYKNKKIINLIIIILFLLIIGLFGMFEYKNQKIDEYNFEQLEQAKPILESLPKNAPKFRTLKEFNLQNKMNIKPIKGCYFIKSDYLGYKYLFGFQLESFYFFFKNGGIRFMFPDNNFDFDMCFRDFGGGSCTKDNEIIFYKITGQSCR